MSFLAIAHSNSNSNSNNYNWLKICADFVEVQIQIIQMQIDGGSR